MIRDKRQEKCAVPVHLGLPCQQSLGCVMVVQERQDRLGAGAVSKGCRGSVLKESCSRAVGDNNLPFAKVGLNTAELRDRW